MAIVHCEELPRERSLSGKVQETDTYTRSFRVRTDDPAENLIDVSNAPGIALKDSHPENVSIVAMEYDVKCIHDSGLLYAVSFKYYAAPVDLPKEDGGDPPPPGQLSGINKRPTWSAGSSVTTGPVTHTVDTPPKEITNSAGDPLEDVVCEQAEFRLSTTRYALTAAAWTGDAVTYTNAVNSDIWHGGEPGTWKCQGCSAQLQTENIEGITVEYWEVTWEFAYRATGWQLILHDIGYNQLVNEDGEPSSSGEERKVIVGHDNKPVQGPVGLCEGVAVPAGQKPCPLTFNVYKQQPFANLFGQIFP
jgi:hypothetical protein